MADLQTRLAELASAVANPKSRLEYYLGQGKKVVGCFPAYTPEELVHASGMIPMGLWGAQTEWKEVKRYLPAFACPIMQSNLELGLRGAYKGLSAVIIPTLCDTFRCISQDWRFAVTDIPMVPVTQPQNNANDGSTDFLVAEYEAVLTKLSVLTGMKMTDAALEETIEIYNEHSRLMQEFTRVANDHLDIITPTIRHIIMKSAQFYEKAEHSAVMKDIIAGLNGLAKYEFTGKKVILSGITAEPTEILDILSEYKIAVVGDDLVQESHQYRVLIPDQGGSAIRRLALQWRSRKGCSLIHEDFKSRGEMLAELAKKNGATGAIYCQMKFCDPEEYDYPICARKLRAEGIQVLQLDIDQQKGSFEQVRTRIQTFSEML